MKLHKKIMATRVVSQKADSAAKNKHPKNRFVQCYQEKFSELENG
jgi:hypothetical protein